MRTIAIHSQKGGVGKTTVALLLAKAAAATGKVCLVDCDYIGSGIADLLPLASLPACFLEDYFLEGKPHDFQLSRLLASYRDSDLGPREVAIALSQFKGAPSHEARKERDKRRQVRDAMMGLLANERQYEEIQAKTSILQKLLAGAGFDLAIFDCHPGLGFVSETLLPLANLNVYVTTLNRSDCFGLLKNLNWMERKPGFLLLNKSQPSISDLATFRAAMGSDPLVGAEAGFFLDGLRGTETHFAVVPETEELRLVFYLGGTGFLPRVDDRKPEFCFVRQILSLV